MRFLTENASSHILFRNLSVKEKFDVTGWETDRMSEIAKILRMKAALALSGLMIMSGSAHAQLGDLSPVLLIESGPSDNPQYRRMVFVKFLSGEQVTVAYKAYNRTEFIQVEDDTPETLRFNCANGPASSLQEIDQFQQAEADAVEAGDPPSITRFCVKNVQNWEGGNRARYLDPIFEGMPHAASLNN